MKDYDCYYHEGKQETLQLDPTVDVIPAQVVVEVKLHKHWGNGTYLLYVLLMKEGHASPQYSVQLSLVWAHRLCQWIRKVAVGAHREGRRWQN